MSNRLLVQILTAICLPVLAVTAAAEDCSLGERYLALAKDAEADGRPDDQLDFLKKATAACGAHEMWLALGSVYATGTGATDAERAAEAFVAAYETAESRSQEASAVHRYAELLYLNNDSQKALPYIFAARDLDPGNAEISALADRIAATTEAISEEEIVRGLGALALKPLQLKTPEIGDDGPMDGGDGGSGGSGGAPSPSVNIPLNFEFATTRLTPGSQANVAVLARTLAARYADKEIVFLGHADVRGDVDFNLALSLSRAEAVRAQVVAFAPSLEGQIAVVGKGESEPLTQGSSDRDHQINRRLEIKVR